MTNASETPAAMIIIVGPSGAGKDSLMAFAADRLGGRPDIGFVRRVITRPADAGGEAHHAASDDAFAAMAAAGQFAVAWRAHGHHYGIPGDTLDAVLSGRTLIVNGSRAALADFLAVYPRVEVVHISASRERLCERLMARGRETAADILARLDRPSPPFPAGVQVHDIDNSGELADAGRQLVVLIEAIAARTL